MIKIVDNYQIITKKIRPLTNRVTAPFSRSKSGADSAKLLHKTFVKLSKEQIRIGRNMNNGDAAKYYFNIIADSMHIPTELRPKLIIEELNSEAPGLSGCYNFGNNTLAYFTQNTANQKRGKWWTFGLIRHEMEHFRQYIDIFRNKDLFKELCNYYTTLGKNENIHQIEINNFIKKLNDMRTNILKYYSETSKNSPDYKKTKKYLDCEINYSTYNYKNIKQFFGYFLQPMEFDACKAQGLNWINYLKTAIFG